MEYMLPLLDAAALVGVSRATAYRLAQTGAELVTGVPIVRSGGRWKVSAEKLAQVAGIRVVA